jgi:molybdopterin-containing oxidoreductase family molybdopterin binding subunit
MADSITVCRKGYTTPSASSHRPFGRRVEDAVNSELILIWGGNPVVTRSVDYSPLKEARRNGTKLICIDPTRSATSDICDSWITLRPGTDGALALALLNQIIDTKAIDESFLLQHTNAPFLVRLDVGTLLRESDLSANGSAEYVVWCVDRNIPVPISSVRSLELSGRYSVTMSDGQKVDVASVFELLRELAAEHTAEAASQITDVPADTIRNLAAAVANAKPAAIRAGYGIDRYYFSDLTMRAIAALAIVTGNIGKPGGGVSINGGDKVAPIRARSFYSPDGKAPHRMFGIMQADAAVTRGVPYPIKMECISFGNPFNQGKPNRQKVISEYIDQLEFITVIDHFMTDCSLCGPCPSCLHHLRAVRYCCRSFCPAPATRGEARGRDKIRL